jgi:hypothetical protein
MCGECDICTMLKCFPSDNLVTGDNANYTEKLDTFIR